MIWRICGSLRLSQILSKIKNLLTVDLSQIFYFDRFLNTAFLTSEWIAGLKMVFLVFFCWLEGFFYGWGWVKILSKIENFHDRGP